MSLLDDALKVINTHSYSICKECKKASKKKRKCKEYCLPVEMFVQLLPQCDDFKLAQLENIEYLFVDSR